MSNEIHCNLFGYGPVEPLSNFRSDFTRDGFLADVPIPAGGPDDRERRKVAHGTRFIYPSPGIKWQGYNQKADTDEIQEVIKDVERESYEGWNTPSKEAAGDQEQFSLTFTCPSDPPGIWITKVVERYFDSGLRFIFRWRDLDNYWRCVKCGAFDGFCTRVGAFCSVTFGPDPEYRHVATWWGRNPCKCASTSDHRAIWNGSDDNEDYEPTREICSITAVDERNGLISW